MTPLERFDPEIGAIIERERARISDTLNLVAAEHHPPPAVLAALGSVLHAKTIEGYPGRRFHGGCVNADRIESLAVSRAAALFNADHVNVQPHSGTAANLAVLFGLLSVGDRVLAMDLAHGGHLSHGHRASITSRCFSFQHYGVDPATEVIDYAAVAEQARLYRPRMIIAGASSYPRCMDYERLSEIARETGALFFVDMAHIAGLVAAGVIASPVPFADAVTFTCYKTMGGCRGGMILSKQAHAKRIDAAIFPGCQGTSAVDVMAAKAVTFKMAGTAEFITLQKNTVANSKRLAQGLSRAGYRIVTGGTDTHQVLVDVSAKGIDGAWAQERLESVGLVTNRNAIPADAGRQTRVSGVRLGTAAVSARGMGPAEMDTIAAVFDAALSGLSAAAGISAREDVLSLCRRHPVAGL